MGLKQTITDLAETFTAGILTAIRGASLEELNDSLSDAAAPRPRAAVHVEGDSITVGFKTKKKGKGGRLPRRSEEDIAAVVAQIVACVKSHPEGIGAEALRKELKIDKKELGKPILTALEEGKLRKEGEKRATVYFVKGASGGAKKASVKPAKKKATPKKVKAKASAPKKKAAAPKKKATKKSAANGAVGHSAPAAKSEPAQEATE